MKDIKEINVSSVVVRREDIDATDLNGEKVMMDLNKGRYFALNEVGSKIWDIIHRPVEIKDIIGTLLREYDIDEESCREQVIGFIGSMSNAEIIQVD
jgi:hypothetical protein